MCDITKEKRSTYINNSQNFVVILKSTKIDNEDHLVSFDFESLYTNDAQDEIIKKTYRRWNNESNQFTSKIR